MSKVPNLASEPSDEDMEFLLSPSRHISHQSQKPLGVPGTEILCESHNLFQQCILWPAIHKTFVVNFVCYTLGEHGEPGAENEPPFINMPRKDKLVQA